MKTSYLLLLTASLALVSGCCGAVNKVKECAAVTKIVNEGTTKAKAAMGAPNAASFRKFADAYDEIDKNLGAATVGDAEIKTEVTEYRAMCKDITKASRDFASAEDAKNVARMKSAQAEIDAAATREKAIVDRLNKTCH